MKAAKLETGVGSQEPGGQRKKEGARRSVFTNIEMLPCPPGVEILTMQDYPWWIYYYKLASP
jgi:hypothetical protein